MEDYKEDLKEIYLGFVQLSRDIDLLLLKVDQIYYNEYYRRLCILRNMKNLADRKFFFFNCE